MKHTSYTNHLAGLKKIAVDDPVERWFGEMTGQMQYSGQIGIIHAGTVVQVRINGDYHMVSMLIQIRKLEKWAYYISFKTKCDYL